MLPLRRTLTMVIRLKDKKLWISGHMTKEGSNEGKLIPVGKNEFNASGLPSPITFIKDASGKISSFMDHDLVPFTFKKVKNTQ